MFGLLCLLLIVVIIAYARTPPKAARQTPNYAWFKTGGTLGAAMLLSRLTRLPLTGIIALLPFLASLHKPAAQNTAIAMSPEEARLILGVTLPDDTTAIKQAHRRLIQKNHPDTGGSEYLAAKINQARDILLALQQ